MRGELIEMIHDQIRLNEQMRNIFTLLGLIILCFGVILLIYNVGTGWIAVGFGVFLLLLAGHAQWMMFKLQRVL